MFKQDTLFIQALDGSRVSIFEIHLPACWFNIYTITGGVDLTLGLNSVLFYKVLSTRDAGQTLEIDFTHDDSDRLSLHFVASETSKTSGFDKHFDIPLIELDCETMHIPEIDFQAEFSMPSPAFASLIHQLQVFGDTVQIECSEEKIRLSSKSIETGTMSVDIPIDDLSEFSINEGEIMTLSFSLMQLHYICQYSKIAKEIIVKLSSSYPLCLQYVFGDVPTTGSDEQSTSANITFYLAPKMTDED